MKVEEVKKLVSEIQKLTGKKVVFKEANQIINLPGGPGGVDTKVEIINDGFIISQAQGSKVDSIFLTEEQLHQIINGMQV